MPRSLDSASLSVSEGQTVTLSGANFGITDADDSSFTYTVSGISGGYFQLSTAAGTPITSFTSADLTGSLVQFVDNGDEFAPSFSVTVNDGDVDSNTLAATISYTAVNDAPTFIDGSVGNWNFDEGSGDSIVESAIGISTGTLGSTAGADANDPTWTTGKFGQALHFDGVNDYIEIADAPGIDISGPQFSASLWMNPDSGPNKEDMLFMKGDRQGNINYYLSWKNSGEMTWAFKDSAGWHYQDMPVTMPTTGQWNHIGITFDRPTVSLYVNGTKYVFDNVATGGSMDRDLTANDEVLWIGAGRDADALVGVNQWSGPFTGSIDELALFDRALTDAEIEAIRTSTPPAVTASVFSIDENSANNTVVGTVVANDQDIGDTLSYAITAGNTGGAFSIDANGQIKVANSTALDFETNPTFSLTIQVEDTGTLTDTASVTINLNDLNEAPTINDAAFNVDENATNGTAVGNVPVTDPDAGDTHVYSITAGNTGGAFAIDNTGNITVANLTALNFETTPVFTLTVQIKDQGGTGLTDTATITVNLNDLNDAPVDLLATATTDGGISLNADGGNDVYFVADDGAGLLGGLTTVTIEASFSITTAGADLSPLLSYAAGANDEELALFLKSDGRIWFGARSNGSPIQSTIGNYTQLFDGEVHHVGVSWDSSSGAVVFYVDGQQVESFAGYQTGQTIAAGGELVFGQDQDSVLGGFKTIDVFSGSLYDVRIFNDVRTAVEIARSYNQTLPNTEPGMIANWTFNDLSTGGVITETVSGNNLTEQHVVGAGFSTSVAELTFCVPEDAVNGTVIGSLSAIDPDSGETITYSLIDDAGGRFTINGSNGQITLANASLIDFESASFAQYYR